MLSPINVASFHKQHYAAYTADSPNKFYLIKVVSIIQQLLSEGKIHQPTKSLEIGCADGTFSSKLKKQFNFNTWGIDISENVVQLALKNGVQAITHDIQHTLPFNNHSFDLILACEVIEHIYDTDFLIEEITRLLKRNGLLILTTPNLASLTNRVLLLLGRYPYGPEYRINGEDQAGHIRIYTQQTLIQQFKEHGLKTILCTSPNIIFPMTNTIIPHFFKIIAMRLGDFSPKLGSHIIIIAKKIKDS